MLQRDPQCQLAQAGCTGHSEVAAHILDAADGGRYTLDNLVGACNHCNSASGGRRSHKTAPSQEGAGGAASLNVGGSEDQPPSPPPLNMRLR